MKKKILTLALALVLALSLSIPAFAAVENVTTGNAPTKDVTANVTKTTATAPTTPTYYVTVTWEATGDALAMTQNADSYTWDTTNLKYTRNTTVDGFTGGDKTQTFNLTITNSSDAPINYAVGFAPAQGVTAEASAITSSSLASAAPANPDFTKGDNEITGGVAKSTSGLSSTVTVKNIPNMATSNEAFVIGTFTVTITAGEEPK